VRWLMQTAQPDVRLPALAGAPRCNAVILLWVDAFAVRSSLDSSRCCASRSVMSRGGCGTLGTEYGVIAVELGAAFVRSAVRFAVLKCVATAFYIAGSRLANLAH